jgi:hypothetical protein
MLSISQGSDALSVRRRLVDIVAAIIRGDRFDPFGLVGSKILLSQIACVVAEESIDLFGDFALIKHITSLFRQQTIGNELSQDSEISRLWPAAFHRWYKFEESRPVVLPGWQRSGPNNMQSTR